MQRYEKASSGASISIDHHEYNLKNFSCCSCKAISNEVKRSQLPFSESLSYMDEVPSQGEEKKVRKMLWGFFHSNLHSEKNNLRGLFCCSFRIII